MWLEVELAELGPYLGSIGLVYLAIITSGFRKTPPQYDDSAD
jgi:hypothetical protein